MGYVLEIIPFVKFTNEPELKIDVVLLSKRNRDTILEGTISRLKNIWTVLPRKVVFQTSH